MSRTTLCVLTAAGLALVSSSVIATRCVVLGEDLKRPTGPGAWRVRLLARGRSLNADTRVITALPLHAPHQHIENVISTSAQLQAKTAQSRHASRHQMVWNQR